MAQFKTKHGWEDLTLDKIEPKVEEERRRRRLFEVDVLSDSSSSTSELPYPSRALMSSPLRAHGPLHSDGLGSSGGRAGHRKRSYMGPTDGMSMMSPSKRYRLSPSAHKNFPSGHATWKDMHQLAQSSPIKPRRQQHFTTQAGPNLSFLTSPAFHTQSDDDDDLLPIHSFHAGSRSSPPRTPPMRSRPLNTRRSSHRFGAHHSNNNDEGEPPRTGEEGADLLLYLAASPSPAVGARNRMEPPSTPPPRHGMGGLPSSAMVTPGGSNLFPSTPNQHFDFSDFVNITPSPAQKSWKTPAGPPSARTPMSLARRQLTFDEPLV